MGVLPDGNPLPKLPLPLSPAGGTLANPGFASFVFRPTQPRFVIESERAEPWENTTSFFHPAKPTIMILHSALPKNTPAQVFKTTLYFDLERSR